MQEITITVPNAPDVKLTGKHLGNASSERPNVKFWTELDAYLTKGGKYVVVTRGVPRYSSGKEKVQVEVFEDKDELVEFIGTGSLAMRLYSEMGIDSISID
ncbi:hypothetical protein [Sinisalibacter lacisalsi]|uniref:Uncharacterized protein n=1 Tax=Sinisalibacter lacisalsi TaxID=1526570 RepID=A0ABQ1QAQ6_9RHOB|nr:hypothetical protein [Sinisalibacter lacisalsi]GGD19493.1 hypothetical protein GCM10011358_00100 [Sinisalibacter lacisalsi]